MNQFFSFSRFRLLALKHWADNRRRYLLSLLALVGLLAGWFALVMIGNEKGNPMGTEVQKTAYFFLLFVAGAFYASQYFRDLGSKAKGSNFLLVPASTYEKLLCALLFAVLLFFVAFTAAFYLVDFIMVQIANSYWDEGKASVINIMDTSVLQFREAPAIRAVSLFLLVQSAFLLGSVYFERYSFIRTVISGFVVGFILFTLIYFLYDRFTPWGDFPEGFFVSSGVDLQGIEERPVNAPAWIGGVYRFLLAYALAPFFWLVTYYRLKEKQV